MPENATIVIPDISGYTEFLTKTEIEHSSHIINELLDLLVNSNSIGLTLSEVEGDALLFYRKGKPIELEPLVQQCTNMFTNFHTQLKIIERDTICQCGACHSASSLSLKFIAHHGTVKELRVSGFTKVSGVDMVIAHRLLKNSIESNEYILVTKNYLDHLNGSPFPSGLSWQHAKEEYPAIGNIDFEYSLLEGIKNAIPPVPKREEHVTELGQNALTVEIEAPIQSVYQKLIDIDRRSNWFIGSQVTERQEVTERVGLKHMCLFLGMMFEVTIVESQIRGSEIVYVDDAKMVKSGTRIRHIYVLKPVSNEKTLLNYEFKHMDGPEVPQELSDNLPIIFKRNLETLKQLCENRELIVD